MRSGSSIGERLFGIVLGFFLGVVLLSAAVRALIAIWPVLLVIAIIVAAIGGALWWLRSRSNDW